MWEGERGDISWNLGSIQEDQESRVPLHDLPTRELSLRSVYDCGLELFDTDLQLAPSPPPHQGLCIFTPPPTTLDATMKRVVIDNLPYFNFAALFGSSGT